MVLRDIDGPAYETLARRFRMYAACVGLVDTGYFRKRSPLSDNSEMAVPETSYEANSGSNQQLSRKRLAPGNDDAWDSFIPDYAGTEPSRSDANRLEKRPSGSQLLDDADDIGRSILALYIKGRHLTEDDRRSVQQDTEDGVQYPQLLANRYDAGEYPLDVTY